MTGNTAKISTTEHESPVDVCQETAKMLDFRCIRMFGAFCPMS